MRRFALLPAAVLFALIAAAAAAKPLPTAPRPAATGPIHVGAPVGAAKAAGDSTLVMGPGGSGAPYRGDFESPQGGPAWNGWTSADLSVGSNPWHADTDGAISGLWSAWCGEAGYPSCGPGDPAGGYGNLYDAVLEWRAAVADPGQPCTVTVTATADHDVEPGYDACALRVETAAGTYALWSADGTAQGVAVVGSHYYQPSDYLPGGEVAVQFRVTSDGSFSDEDCLYPSAGALRVDDVVITLDNGTGASHDFEDGTLGPFTAVAPVGVGDFARLWTGLEDLDPCQTNYTVQAAFLDDGVVVPGTGGSFCVNWCYGPNGFIVNPTGGLAGPDHHLHNVIVSPAMAWPDPGMGAARLDWDALLHEDLSVDAPGMFPVWGVRSTPSSDPADLEAAPWRSIDFLTYDWDGRYRRERRDLTSLLEPGRQWVQVRLGVHELGWAWGWVGTDGYPAPYYDNVRLVAWETGGPSLAARELELAQDGFPAQGYVDPAQPGTNAVRIDMARNVSTVPGLIDPGDSLVVDAGPARPGAVLIGPPVLHYRLLRNPVFDPWRTSGLPDAGAVACDSARAAGGEVAVGRWSADLPDSGFLFPGDVLRYFFTAADDVAGDVRAAILPADTTGFSDLGDPLAYDPAFTMRALPTLTMGPGDLLEHRATTLLWLDTGDSGLDAAWLQAMRDNKLEPGVGFDLYRTAAAAAADGNGLGGRATAAHLAGYLDLVYGCGERTWATLGTGTPSGDLSRDVQLLDGWLALGGRDAFLAGDDLASDVAASGATGAAFVQGRLGVDVADRDLRPLIDGQTAPLVRAPAGGPLDLTGSWIAYGGCLRVNTFDAVTPRAGAERLADFTDLAGQVGIYPHSALTLNATGSSRVVSMPYDLGFVYGDPGRWYLPPGADVRHSLLRDVGILLGFVRPVSAVPDAGTAAAAFATRHYPNPFNPEVAIACAVPRPGRLLVKVFDVRGRLVRTLHDGPVADDVTLTWDGRDGDGSRAASGVYFYEARLDGEARIGRMTLVK